MLDFLPPCNYVLTLWPNLVCRSDVVQTTVDMFSLTVNMLSLTVDSERYTWAPRLALLSQSACTLFCDKAESSHILGATCMCKDSLCWL